MASRTAGTTTTLIVSPRGQITLPKPVRARLRLAPGSVLLLREEAGKIVLDPAAVTQSRSMPTRRSSAWSGRIAPARVSGRRSAGVGA